MWIAIAIILTTPISLSCDTPDEVAVRVIQYRGPVISKETYTDDAWNASVSGNIVTLEQFDESINKIRRRLILSDEGTELPGFIVYVQYFATESDPYTLIEGEVAIQSFDLAGTISGTVSGTIRQGSFFRGIHGGGTFWIDIAEDDAADE